MKIIDNNVTTLKESLIARIQEGDRVSIAASCFSMYAFNELKEQFQQLDELRFIFTSPSFVKSEKNNSIINNDSESSLSGSSFEVQLRNALSQKAIARECVEWIKRENVYFRSISRNEGLMGFATVQSNDRKQYVAYTPVPNFTTVELGTSKPVGVSNIIVEMDSPEAKQFVNNFDAIWKDKKKIVDVKEEIINRISDICAENSPESIYYVALNHIFSDFLRDITNDDFSANEKTGFKNSVIWNKLYDFQYDAALAIINKLEKYNGCILADSVGLGKTYTALAVIKYYESRNKNVLVLCPKKLSDNWKSFRGNFVNNPLLLDKFRYDVYYHTDLSRIGKNTKGSQEINMINWDNYDLVVIDESHNFRNGGSGNNPKMNRYQVLLDRVIRSGVNTKVLMLSATPVNNRFWDLKNQLELAYEDGDPTKMEEQLSTRNTIDGIFNKAQATFNKWISKPANLRTTDALIKDLDYDFFELLDSVTIARSRKHIQSYYDMNAIGPFPKRLPPVAVSPYLSNLNEALGYNEIFETLLNLNLTIYTPAHFIKPEYRYLYQEKFGGRVNKGFSQEEREIGLRNLMASNLMKRLESSVSSFRLTVTRIENQLSETINKIDNFIVNHFDYYAEELGYDTEDSDYQEFNEDEIVSKKVQINFSHMELDTWKVTLEQDLIELKKLKTGIASIDSYHDNKLQELCSIIKQKVNNPINDGNKKILIFSAFADTAEYLYENVSQFAKTLGLETAVVTGTGVGKCTIKNLPVDFNMLLTCFSPKSKQRDLISNNPTISNANIDILIGTDCISEGQNLQDCDYCINYDIHWNPVRIIQRYGRIDRIGSENDVIQLVNFWPDVSLDEYINLKQRVETRMKIVNIAATPEEQILSDEERVDLEYRKSQLEKLKTEIIDIEDMSNGVSLTDLGLNEFKLDLLDYVKGSFAGSNTKKGVYAVTASSSKYPKGMIWVLKNISIKTKIKNPNRMHPYYLVYITDDGRVVYNYLNPKEVLRAMKALCKGVSEPLLHLCQAFNTETQNGKDMSKYSTLLNNTIKSIVEVKKETDIKGLFKVGGTNFGKNDKIEGIDDFELICFLVVK